MQKPSFSPPALSPQIVKLSRRNTCTKTWNNVAASCSSVLCGVICGSSNYSRSLGPGIPENEGPVWAAIKGSKRILKASSWSGLCRLADVANVALAGTAAR